MTNEYPLVLIEWVDSAQPVGSWRYIDDLPELEPVRCVSVGWKVAENEHVTMLAPNIGDFETAQGPQASGFIRIPRACITRVASLVEVTT